MVVVLDGGSGETKKQNGRGRVIDREKRERVKRLVGDCGDGGGG